MSDLETYTNTLKHLVEEGYEKLTGDINSYTLHPDLKSIIQYLAKIDPLWVNEFLKTALEEGGLAMLIIDPESYALSNPEGFVKACRENPSDLTEDLFYLWHKIDEESLRGDLERAGRYPKGGETFWSAEVTLERLGEAWAKTYPESYLRACHKSPIVGLRYTYETWKTLDPQGHLAACDKNGPALMANREFGNNWARDSLPKLVKTMYEVTKGRLNGAHSGLPRTIDPETAGIWATADRKSFLDFCQKKPKYAVAFLSETWAQTDKESYLTACHSYPKWATGALLSAKTLRDTDLEFFKSNTDLGAAHWYGHGQFLAETDWEKYGQSKESKDKFNYFPELWFEKDPEGFKAYAAEVPYWGIWAGTLARIAKLDVEATKRLAEEKLARVPEFLDSYLWKEEDLKALLETDPKLWATAGACNLRVLLNDEEGSPFRESSYYEDSDYTGIIGKVVDTVQHYQEHGDELVVALQNPDAHNVEPYLDLVPFLLNEEQTQDLARGLLERLGQDTSKITWAATHLSSGSIEEGSKARRVKVATRRNTETGRERA
jgi:hypothetical protein